MDNFLNVLQPRSRPASLRSRKSTNSDPNRIAPPSHRHAAPSAPWPWVDIGDGEQGAFLYRLGKPCSWIGLPILWFQLPSE